MNEVPTPKELAELKTRAAEYSAANKKLYKHLDDIYEAQYKKDLAKRKTETEDYLDWDYGQCY